MARGIGVGWEDLSAEECENLVAVLLQELHPDGRRVDGRGGDGGRDFEVSVEGGWHRFQVKSWTREFGKSQRQQLKESLDTALAADPVQVTVVVPLDQNPSAIEWLAKQQATTSVPLEWRGRTWLEAQLSTRPHLVRAFARTHRERMLELANDYRIEQTALLGNEMPDAIFRTAHLRQLTDEVDPHYQFGIQTAPGRTTITIIPRTERSLEQRPITISTEYAFPVGDPDAVEALAALRRSVDYGDPVTIPAAYVTGVHADLPGGLGGELGGGTVTMQPQAALPWGPDGRLVQCDHDGRAQVHLPVRFTNTATGQRGLVVWGEDPTGILRFELRRTRPGLHDPAAPNPDSKRHTIRFTLGQLDGKLPAEILPPLRFFATVLKVPRLRLITSRVTLADIPVTAPDPRVTPGEETPAPASLERELAAVEALDRIQDRAGKFFPMPLELTVPEGLAVTAADVLLRERQVTAPGGRVTVWVTRERAARLLEEHPSGTMAMVLTNQPYPVRVAGCTLDIGPVVVTSPRAAYDVDALRARLARPPAGPDGQEELELILTVDAEHGPVFLLAPSSAEASVDAGQE